jgi:hypothetical protein
MLSRSESVSCLATAPTAQYFDMPGTLVLELSAGDFRIDEFRKGERARSTDRGITPGLEEQVYSLHYYM